MMGMNPSEASDVFSWGAVAHYALSGKRALHGNDPTEVLLRYTKAGAPELPNDVEVSDAFRWMIKVALDHVPEARFQTGRKLLKTMDKMPL